MKILSKFNHLHIVESLNNDPFFCRPQKKIFWEMMLFGFQHSSRISFVLQKKEIHFRMAWGWINGKIVHAWVKYSFSKLGFPDTLKLELKRHSVALTYSIQRFELYLHYPAWPYPVVFWWNFFSFGYDRHLSCHCFNNLMQCAAFFQAWFFFTRSYMTDESKQIFTKTSRKLCLIQDSDLLGICSFQSKWNIFFSQTVYFCYLSCRKGECVFMSNI